MNVRSNKGQQRNSGGGIKSAKFITVLPGEFVWVLVSMADYEGYLDAVDPLSVFFRFFSCEVDWIWGWIFFSVLIGDWGKRSKGRRKTSRRARGKRRENSFWEGPSSVLGSLESLARDDRGQMRKNADKCGQIR